MTFWKAYKHLRSLPGATRAEEVAVGAEVSIHAVDSWDRNITGRRDAHARNPSHFNRIRLARFAESVGAPAEVVAALTPDTSVDART